jgi:DNA-binding response OmpR family regulator
MLEVMGLGVRQAGSAEEALAQLEIASVDLAFIDLPLPDMGDPELLQQARRMSPDMLIIVQNGQPTIESTIAAIKVGVTDYLIGLADSKRVFDAITEALRWRDREKERQNERISQQVEAYLESKGMAQDATAHDLPLVQSMLTYGQFDLDRQARRLSLNDRSATPVELTKGEVEVLAALMSRPGSAMSCQEIVRVAFRYNITELEAQSVIRPYVSRLRQKFGDADYDRRLISTVRGRGYVFAEALAE